MNVVGKTNKDLVVQSENHKGGNAKLSHLSKHGSNGKKVKKYNPNKSNHKQQNNKKKSHNYNRDERDYCYNPDEFGFGE